MPQDIFNPYTGEIISPEEARRRDLLGLRQSNALLASATTGMTTLHHIRGNDLEDIPSFVSTGSPGADIKEMEYARADNMGAMESFGRGLAGRTLSIVPKVGKTIGNVLGVFPAIAEGSLDPIIDNDIVRGFEEIDQDLRTGFFEVPTSRKYAEGDWWDKLGTAKFWGEDAGDALAYATSAYITGAGMGAISKAVTPISVAKKLQAANRIAAAGKNLKNAKSFQVAATEVGLNKFWSKVGTLNNAMAKASSRLSVLPENFAALGTTSINVLSEASAESLEFKNTLLDKLAQAKGFESFAAIREGVAPIPKNIEQGISVALTKEDAEIVRNQLQAEAAPRVAALFRSNAAALVFTDAIQTKAYFGGKSRAAQSLGRQVKNGTLKAPTVGRTMTRVGKSMLSEMFEESYQMNAARLAEDQYEAGVEPGIITNPIETIQYIQSNITEDEDMTAKVISGLLGAKQGAVETYRKRQQYNKGVEQHEEMLSTHTELINAVNELYSKDALALEKKTFERKNPETGEIEQIADPDKIANLLLSQNLDKTQADELAKHIYNGETAQAEKLKETLLGRRAFSYFEASYFDDTEEAKQALIETMEADFAQFESPTLEDKEELAKKIAGIEEYANLYEDIQQSARINYSRKGVDQTQVSLGAKIAYAKEHKLRQLQTYIDEELYKLGLTRKDYEASLTDNRYLQQFQISDGLRSALQEEKAYLAKYGSDSRARRDKLVKEGVEYVAEVRSSTDKLAELKDLVTGNKDFESIIKLQDEISDIEDQIKTASTEEEIDEEQLEELQKSLKSKTEKHAKLYDKLKLDKDFANYYAGSKEIELELEAIYGKNENNLMFLTNYKDLDVENMPLAGKHYMKATKAANGRMKLVQALNGFKEDFKSADRQTQIQMLQQLPTIFENVGTINQKYLDEEIGKLRSAIEVGMSKPSNAFRAAQNPTINHVGLFATTMPNARKAIDAITGKDFNPNDMVRSKEDVQYAEDRFQAITKKGLQLRTLELLNEALSSIERNPKISADEDAKRLNDIKFKLARLHEAVNTNTPYLVKSADNFKNFGKLSDAFEALNAPTQELREDQISDYLHENFDKLNELVTLLLDPNNKVLKGLQIAHEKETKGAKTAIVNSMLETFLYANAENYKTKLEEIDAALDILAIPLSEYEENRHSIKEQIDRILNDDLINSWKSKVNIVEETFEPLNNPDILKLKHLDNRIESITSLLNAYLGDKEFQNLAALKQLEEDVDTFIKGYTYRIKNDLNGSKDIGKIKQVISNAESIFNEKLKQLKVLADKNIEESKYRGINNVIADIKGFHKSLLNIPYIQTNPKLIALSKAVEKAENLEALKALHAETLQTLQNVDIDTLDADIRYAKRKFFRKYVKYSNNITINMLNTPMYINGISILTTILSDEGNTLIDESLPTWGSENNPINKFKRTGNIYQLKEDLEAYIENSEGFGNIEPSATYKDKTDVPIAQTLLEFVNNAIEINSLSYIEEAAKSDLDVRRFYELMKEYVKYDSTEFVPTEEQQLALLRSMLILNKNESFIEKDRKALEAFYKRVLQAKDFSKIVHPEILEASKEFDSEYDAKANLKALQAYVKELMPKVGEIADGSLILEGIAGTGKTRVFLPALIDMYSMNLTKPESTESTDEESKPIIKPKRKKHVLNLDGSDVEIRTTDEVTFAKDLLQNLKSFKQISLKLLKPLLANTSMQAIFDNVDENLVIKFGAVSSKGVPAQFNAKDNSITINRGITRFKKSPESILSLLAHEGVHAAIYNKVLKPLPKKAKFSSTELGKATIAFIKQLYNEDLPASTTRRLSRFLDGSQSLEEFLALAIDNTSNINKLIRQLDVKLVRSLSNIYKDAFSSEALGNEVYDLIQGELNFKREEEEETPSIEEAEEGDYKQSDNTDTDQKYVSALTKEIYQGSSERAKRVLQQYGKQSNLTIPQRKKLLKKLARKYHITTHLRTIDNDTTATGAKWLAFSEANKTGISVTVSADKENFIPKETIQHEFMHPFVNILRAKNPELFNTILNAAVTTFPHMRGALSKHYSNIHLDAEIVTRYLETEALLNNADKSLLAKFWEWLTDLFYGLRKNNSASLAKLDANTSIEQLYKVFRNYGNINTDAAIVTNDITRYAEYEEAKTNYAKAVDTYMLTDMEFARVQAEKAKARLLTATEAIKVNQYVQASKDVAFNKATDVAAMGNTPAESLNLNAEVLNKNDDILSRLTTKQFASGKMTKGTLTVDGIKVVNEKTKLLIFDEIYAISANRTEKFFKQLRELNAERIKNGLPRVKFIGVGDPNQISEDGTSGRRALIQSRVLSHIRNVGIVGPLVQSRRSGNLEIAKMATAYVGVTNTVIPPHALSTRSIDDVGGYGVKGLQDEDKFLSLLDRTVESYPNKSKMLIVFDRMQYEKLNVKYGKSITVRHVNDIKGEQADQVFIHSISNKGYTTPVDFNAQMYTSFSRGQELVTILSPNIKSSQSKYAASRAISNIPSKEKVGPLFDKQMENLLSNLDKIALVRPTNPVMNVQSQESEEKFNEDTSNQENTAEYIEDTPASSFVRNRDPLQYDQLDNNKLMPLEPSSAAIKRKDYNNPESADVVPGDKVFVTQVKLDKFDNPVFMLIGSNKHGDLYELGIFTEEQVNYYKLAQLKGDPVNIQVNENKFIPGLKLEDFEPAAYLKPGTQGNYISAKGVLSADTRYEHFDIVDTTRENEYRLADERRLQNGTLNYIVNEVAQHVGIENIHSVKIKVFKRKEAKTKVSGKPYVVIKVKGRKNPIIISTSQRRIHKQDEAYIGGLQDFLRAVTKLKEDFPNIFDWNSADFNAAILAGRKGLTIVQKGNWYNVEINQNFKELRAELEKNHKSILNRIDKDREGQFMLQIAQIAKLVYGPEEHDFTARELQSREFEKLKFNENVTSIENWENTLSADFNAYKQAIRDTVVAVLQDNPHLPQEQIERATEEWVNQLVLNPKYLNGRSGKYYVGKNLNLGIRYSLYKLRDTTVKSKNKSEGLIADTIKAFNEDTSKNIYIYSDGSIGIKSGEDIIPLKAIALKKDKGQAQRNLNSVASANIREDNNLVLHETKTDTSGNVVKNYTRAKKLIKVQSTEKEEFVILRNFMRTLSPILGESDLYNEFAADRRFNVDLKALKDPKSALHRLFLYAAQSMKVKYGSIKASEELPNVYEEFILPLTNREFKTEQEIKEHVQKYVNLVKSEGKNYSFNNVTYDFIMEAVNAAFEVLKFNKLTQKMTLEDLQKLLTFNSAGEANARIPIAIKTIETKAGEVNMAYVGTNNSANQEVELWDRDNKQLIEDVPQTEFFNRNLISSFIGINETEIVMDVESTSQQEAEDVQDEAEDTIFEDLLEDEESDDDFQFTTKISNKYISFEEAYKYIEKLLPNVDKSTIKFLTKEAINEQTNNKFAYGYYRNGVVAALQKNNKVNKASLAHELFHRIFDTALSASDKDTLYKAVAKINPQLQAYYEQGRLDILEEHLAYKFQYKESAGFIERVFNKIKNIFKSLKDNERIIEAYFRNIKDGKFSNYTPSTNINRYMVDIEKFGSVENLEKCHSIVQDAIASLTFNGAYIPTGLTSAPMNYTIDLGEGPNEVTQLNTIKGYSTPMLKAEMLNYLLNDYILKDERSPVLNAIQENKRIRNAFKAKIKKSPKYFKNKFNASIEDAYNAEAILTRIEEIRRANAELTNATPDVLAYIKQEEKLLSLLEKSAKAHINNVATQKAAAYLNKDTIKDLLEMIYSKPVSEDSLSAMTDTMSLEEFEESLTFIEDEKDSMLTKHIQDAVKRNWKNELNDDIKSLLIGITYRKGNGHMVTMSWQESYARMLYLFDTMSLENNTDIIQFLKSRVENLSTGNRANSAVIARIEKIYKLAKADSYTYTFLNENGKPTPIKTSYKQDGKPVYRKQVQVRVPKNEVSFIDQNTIAIKGKNVKAPLPEDFKRFADSAVQELKKAKKHYRRNNSPYISQNNLLSSGFKDFLKSKLNVTNTYTVSRNRIKGRLERTSDFIARIVESPNFAELSYQDIAVRYGNLIYSDMYAGIISHFGSLNLNNFVSGVTDLASGEAYTHSLSGLSTTTARREEFASSILRAFTSAGVPQAVNVEKFYTSKARSKIYDKFNKKSTSIENAEELALYAKYLQNTLKRNITEDEAYLRAMLKFLRIDIPLSNVEPANIPKAAKALAEILLPVGHLERKVAPELQKAYQVVSGTEVTYGNVFDIISRQSTRLDTVADMLTTVNSIVESTSYKDGDGDTIYLATIASKGKETVKYLMEKHKGSKTYSALSKPPILHDSNISMYNPFVAETNAYPITDIVDWAYARNKQESTQYNKNIMYKAEMLPDTYRRAFQFGYLNWLENLAAQEYTQYGYVKSEKRELLGITTKMLTVHQINSHLHKMYLQYKNRVKLPGLTADISKLTNMKFFEPILKDLDATSDVETQLNIIDAHRKNYFNNEADLILKDLIGLKTRFANVRIPSSGIVEWSKYLGSSLTSRQIGILAKLHDKTNYKKSAEYAPEEVIEALQPLLEHFAAMNYVNSFFLSQLTLGEFFHYGTAGKVVKRSGTMLNNAQIPLIGELGADATLQVDLVKDIETSKLLNDDQAYGYDMVLDTFGITGADKEAILDAAINLTETDGMGVMLPETLEQFKRGYSDGYGLISVAKPVISTFEVKEVEGKNVAYPIAGKLALFTITPELEAQQPELKRLADKMRREGTHMLLPESAVKVGFPKESSSYADWLEGKDTLTNTYNRLNLRTHDVRMQLNPKHDIEEQTKIFSQLLYFANPLNKNKEETKRMYEATAYLVQSAINKFVEQFGNREEFQGIVDIIKRSLNAASSKPAQHLIDLLDVTKKPWNYPGIDSLAFNKFVSYINKHVIQVEFDGTDLILQADLGYKVAGISPHIKHKLGSKDKLTQLTAAIDSDKQVDPTVYGINQAMVDEIRTHRRRLTYRKGVNGKVLVEAVVPEGLLPPYLEARIKEQLKKGERMPIFKNGDILGWRIPSSELHNAASIQITGFYKDSLKSNIIITPREFLITMGSDYDVDSLYIARRSFLTKPMLFGKLEQLYADIKADKAQQKELKYQYLNSVKDARTLKLANLGASSSNKNFDKYKKAKTYVSKLKSRIDALKSLTKAEQTEETNTELLEKQAEFNEYELRGKKLIAMFKNKANPERFQRIIDNAFGYNPTSYIEELVSYKEPELLNIENALDEIEKREKDFNPVLKLKHREVPVGRGDLFDYIEEEHEYEGEKIFVLVHDTQLPEALNQYKEDNPDAAKDIDTLLTMYYKNEIIEAMNEVMAKNTHRLLEAISSKRIEDDLRDVAGQIYGTENGDPLELLREDLDLSNLRDNIIATSKAKIGAAAIGAVANFSKALSYLWHHLEIKESFSVKNGKEGDSITMTELQIGDRIYNRFSEYEIDIASGEPNKGRSLLQGNDSTLQIFVDNINDNLAGPGNLTLNTIQAFLGLKLLGVDQNTAFRLMLQPIVKQLAYQERDEAWNITHILLSDYTEDNADTKLLAAIKGESSAQLGTIVSLEELNNSLNIAGKLEITDALQYPDVLKTQVKVAHTIKYAETIGKAISDYSRMLNVIKKIPVDEVGYEQLGEAIRDIFDTSAIEEDANFSIEDVYNMPTKDSFPLNIGNVLETTPHVAASIFAYYKMQHARKTMFRFSEQFEELIPKLAVQLKHVTNYNKFDIAKQIRDEIVLYAASGTTYIDKYLDKDPESYTYFSPVTEEYVVGTTAFKAHVVDQTNAVINFVRANNLMDDNINLRYLFNGLTINMKGNVEFHTKINMDIGELERTTLGFELLNRFSVKLNEQSGEYEVTYTEAPESEYSNYQANLIKYLDLEEGHRFHAKSLSSILPDKLKVAFFNDFSKIVEDMIKGNVNLDNLEFSILKKLGKHSNEKRLISQVGPSIHEETGIFYTATIEKNEKSPRNMEVFDNKDIKYLIAGKTNNVHRVVLRTENTLYLQDLGKTDKNLAYSYTNALDDSSDFFNKNVPFMIMTTADKLTQTSKVLPMDIIRSESQSDSYYINQVDAKTISNLVEEAWNNIKSEVEFFNTAMNKDDIELAKQLAKTRVQSYMDDQGIQYSDIPTHTLVEGKEESIPYTIHKDLSKQGLSVVRRIINENSVNNMIDKQSIASKYYEVAKPIPNTDYKYLYVYKAEDTYGKHPILAAMKDKASLAVFNSKDIIREMDLQFADTPIHLQPVEVQTAYIEKLLNKKC